MATAYSDKGAPRESIRWIEACTTLRLRSEASQVWRSLDSQQIEEICHDLLSLDVNLTKGLFQKINRDGVVAFVDLERIDQRFGLSAEMLPKYEQFIEGCEHTLAVNPVLKLGDERATLGSVPVG